VLQVAIPGVQSHDDSIRKVIYGEAPYGPMFTRLAATC
jgi:hypothetical protein